MLWPDQKPSRQFRVTGTGITSGRKRQRVYDALDERHLIQVAEADGTSIDSFEEVPPPPPTENQLNYARKLGIANLPENANYNDVYCLINTAVKQRLIQGGREAGLSMPSEISYEEGRDLEDLLWNAEDGEDSIWGHRSLPTEKEVLDARDVGVSDITRFTSACKLYERVWQLLSSEGDQSRLAGWYIYNVCLDLLQDKQGAVIKPTDPTIISLGSEFLKNEKAVKSLMRSSTYLRFRATPGYGNVDAPHATRETIAFKVAEELIGGAFEIQQSVRSKSPTTKSSPSNQRVQESSGCAGVVAILFVIPLSLAAGLIYAVSIGL
jgi:hypothetical protein